MYEMMLISIWNRKKEPEEHKVGNKVELTNPRTNFDKSVE
jgi:hypothetical protein